MIKNTMQINLSAVELSALLKEGLKQGVKFTLYYNFENSINLGVSYSFDVEDVYYDKKTLDLIFNDNQDSFSILVPEKMENTIECNIVHEQIEEIDYEKLSEADKQDYLYDKLEESSKYKKKTRNIFKVSFDNFSTEIKMEVNKFYGILGNLEKHTKNFQNYLSMIKEGDNKVDIDGFWESVDNVLEN